MRAGATRAVARQGRKRDGASDDKSGWKRDRGIVRATREDRVRKRDERRDRWRNAEGAGRCGTEGGLEGGGEERTRRVKEVRSEEGAREGERVREMRA